MHTQPDGSDEVLALFDREVPELASGVIEIRGIVRERGRRTIVLVHSPDPAVDSVGSFIGSRGVRIKAVVRDLANEKVDVVRWSDSVEQLICHLVTPAKVSRVALNDRKRRAVIHTSPDYQSLVLGPGGSRLQLISRLIGWELEVVSD